MHKLRECFLAASPQNNSQISTSHPSSPAPNTDIRISAPSIIRHSLKIFHRYLPTPYNETNPSKCNFVLRLA